MKPLIFALALLLAPFARAESEKILLITADKIAQVQVYLDQGWTVKHQSISGAYYQTPDYFYCLITLSPPTPEALAALEEKRKQEVEQKKIQFAKKREKYLKQQENKNKVESETKGNK